MTSPVATSPRALQTQLLLWLPIVFGLGVLFFPTLVDLFKGVWMEDEQAHGPIILAISCWLLYSKWPALGVYAKTTASDVGGWTLLIVSLFTYALGRSQAVLQMEVGAVIPFLMGVILITRGGAGLKLMWFPLFFMLFMIPLPGVFVQALTIPLKTAVSFVSEHILYALDYPIARTGVVLQIGQYQMLVADACAGMHTLFTLEALGLLYMNLVGHTSVKRNLTLALLIIPISFVSNVLRVLILILITYYLGDAAGQGFLHGFAGMTLFLSALLLILAVDSLLGQLFKEDARHAG